MFVAVALFGLTVGYFLVAYVPCVWGQRVLRGPYAVLFEVMAYRSRKGRWLDPTVEYQEISEKYHGVIRDCFAQYH